MKSLFSCILACLCLTGAAQRPTIGLALSGGGAKGLAHVGILQAIDSAGLKVDILTGTSMGGVVGALYAVGWTGNQIDSIARAIDWDMIFGTSPSIDRIPVDKKKAVEEQAVEVRFKNGKIQIPTGVLESQELWLLLNEVLGLAYRINHFDELPIRYRCLATDILTGNAVVHEKGNLVVAVRSSMAIPSIFTAIDLDGRRLIDGGVVRNFPVRDAKAMGADLLIGVNVSQAVIPPEQLNSAINILYQTAFLGSSEEFQQDLRLLNQFIDIDLGRFSAASFGSSDSILNLGKAAGDLYYPHFKRLADSLNALYPPAEQKKPLTNEQSVFIRGITIEGLQRTTRTAFLERTGLRANAPYSFSEISEAVREVYATRLYKYITYDLIPNEAGGANIRFTVQEHPASGISAGIHYNTFSNVAVILNYRGTNLLTDKSESQVRVALGDNSRILLKQDQYLGERLNNKLSLSVQFDRVQLPRANQFSRIQQFTENMATYQLAYYRLLGRNRMAGLGISYVNVLWQPQFAGVVTAEGRTVNQLARAYYHYRRHSLPTLSFPTRGFYSDYRVSYSFRQRAFSNVALADGNVERSNLNVGDYFSFQWRLESFIPLNDDWTWLLNSSGGINFTNRDAVLDFFNIGGLVPSFRNQLAFAGFREYELQSNGFGMIQAGLQHSLGGKLFLIGRFNAGLDGLQQLSSPAFTDALRLMLGSSASVGYRSPFGPIDASINYNLTNNAWAARLNLGWWF